MTAADARATADGHPRHQQPAPPPEPPEQASPFRREPKPQLPYGLPITSYSHQELVWLIRWIESDTLLRTEDDLLEEVMEELGFRRRGTRIRDAVAAAVADARR